ncbi:MAG TPA: hypothetical protein PKC72_05220 [Chitinophagaceae bacterium]|nr:hypothetical protein [Chitinophagaceae bacterium]
MPTPRFDKKFRRSLLIYFLIYFAAIPIIYFLLDQDSFLNLFKKDVMLNILKIAGVALTIALVMALWLSRDPELRKW